MNTKNTIAHRIEHLPRGHDEPVRNEISGATVLAVCHQRQDVDEQEHRGAGGREQHERSGHTGDGVDDRRQQYQRRGHRMARAGTLRSDT